MFRLPFVSRALWESSERYSALHRRDLEYAHAALAEAKSDFRELLERYHSLRSAGAAPVSAGLTPELPPHTPSDLAIEQVVERFGGNIKLRRKLLQFQAEQRRGNVDEDEIADRLTNWRDPAADEDAA